MPIPRFLVQTRRHSSVNAHLSDALRANTVSGLIMLGAALAALVWAGVDERSYRRAVTLPLGPMDLGHWASEGLLTIFFFVAGLELKREFTEGTLRRPLDAIVPVSAAVLGMAVPAVVYLCVTAGNDSGWAIPMATDIAFALAVLAVAGGHTPPALRGFLLTLAVVDDLGSILVIAVVFTHSVSWGWLAGAAACAAMWALGQHRHIDNGWLYVPLAVAAWICLLRSGVHPTIAGVVLGLLTRNTAEDLDEPLDRWKSRVEPWSSFLAVPLFALFSAGVHVDRRLMHAVWTQLMPLGIILGLVVGKLLGILMGTGLALRLTPARLGRGIRPLHMVALAQLGGVGLTVSLLLCGLVFGQDQHLVSESKAAVLTGSLISALLASGLLRVSSRSSRSIHRTARARTGTSSEPVDTRTAHND